MFKLQVENEKNKFFLEKEYTLVMGALDSIYCFHEEFRKSAVSYDQDWESKFNSLWDVVHRFNYAITKLNFLGRHELANQAITYLNACEQYIKKVQITMRDKGGDKKQNKIEHDYSRIIKQYTDVIALMNKQFKDRNG